MQLIRENDLIKGTIMATTILEVEHLSNVPFANSPYPMWIYDLDTLAFLKVNRAAVRTYGFSEKEFLRMTVLDIRPPGRRATVP